MIYIGVVLAIASECRDGRTPCAHRRTPDEGPPTKKQSTGLFFLPLLRFALLGISLPAGSDLGRCPKTLRGLCPSTPPPLRKVDEPF